MGPRGDAIAQLDWSVGEVLATLDRLELADDTLVLFTSDNGPVVDDGYRDEAVEKLGDHAPAGPFRGGKYSSFEGGHARSVRRALAGAREAGGVRCADLPGRSHRVVRGARGLVRYPIQARPTARTCCRRCSARRRPAALPSSSRPGRCRSGKETGSTSSPARGREFSRTRTPSSATIPSRSSTIWRRTRASGTISPRRSPEKVRELAAMLEGIRRSRRSAAGPGVRTSSWPSPTTGRFLTPASTAIGPSARRISIVSRGKGSRFTHAFVAAPSCTPSRAALLTGQAVHRLEEGGNLHGFLPKSYPVYPDLLEEAGYVVGHTGKGWGPGRFEAGGRTRNPAGPLFKSFDEFMERRAKGSPFCFWFGSTDPHRPYEPGTGAQSGMKPERVQVPRLPARHRGGPERSARLLLRSPAVRPRSRRASSRRSSARASSRTRSSS